MPRGEMEIVALAHAQDIVAKVIDEHFYYENLSSANRTVYHVQRYLSQRICELLPDEPGEENHAKG